MDGRVARLYDHRWSRREWPGHTQVMSLLIAGTERAESES